MLDELWVILTGYTQFERVHCTRSSDSTKDGVPNYQNLFIGQWVESDLEYLRGGGKIFRPSKISGL
jgi:hypothetical protein